MKKMLLSTIFVILFVALTGCTVGKDGKPPKDVNLNDKSNSEIQFTTPGTNPELDKTAENGKVAGLGTGLWHGLISVVTLVVSFFNPDVQMYEVHNNGPMYNLGFLLGTILLFGILGFAGGRRRRR